MKVVVTGGAGFIGSHLVEAWLKRADVNVIDDLSLGKRENLPTGATFHQGSILTPKLLARVFEGADFVFHEAGLPSVPRSIKNPMESHDVNATGTLHVLEAARAADVEKVVYAASSSAYGDTPTLPKLESMPPAPKSPYAVAKLMGEYYCRAYHEVYGLRTTAVRYFNVYGPKQDPNGEYAAVIPKFITAALAGRDLTIYGDGLQSRDFTFVADAVRVTGLAAESKGADGEVVNAGAGGKITLNELAEKVVALTRSSSKIVHVDPRPGDILHSHASTDKAQRLTGFRPTSTFDQGLHATVQWFTRALPPTPKTRS